VVAGPLMWQLARGSGARITPVDSEHAALYQCLLGEPAESVAGLVLTASGGPFLRSEEHTSELQSRENLVCRLLLEKKKNRKVYSIRVCGGFWFVLFRNILN